MCQRPGWGAFEFKELGSWRAQKPRRLGRKGIECNMAVAERNLCAFGGLGCEPSWRAKKGSVRGFRPPDRRLHYAALGKLRNS